MSRHEGWPYWQERWTWYGHSDHETGSERQVLAAEPQEPKSKPLLYDHRGQPLVRPKRKPGFRP